MNNETTPPLPKLNLVQKVAHRWQILRLHKEAYELCARQEGRAYNNFDDEELARDFEVTLEQEDVPASGADNSNKHESSEDNQLPPATISFMGSIAFANAIVYAYQHMFKKGDK